MLKRIPYFENVTLKQKRESVLLLYSLSLTVARAHDVNKIYEIKEVFTKQHLTIFHKTH